MPLPGQSRPPPPPRPPSCWASTAGVVSPLNGRKAWHPPFKIRSFSYSIPSIRAVLLVRTQDPSASQAWPASPASAGAMGIQVMRLRLRGEGRASPAKTHQPDHPAEPGRHIGTFLRRWEGMLSASAPRRGQCLAPWPWLLLTGRRARGGRLRCAGAQQAHRRQCDGQHEGAEVRELLWAQDCGGCLHAHLRLPGASSPAGASRPALCLWVWWASAVGALFLGGQL